MWPIFVLLLRGLDTATAKRLAIEAMYTAGFEIELGPAPPSGRKKKK
jgi:hypothetical protein